MTDSDLTLRIEHDSSKSQLQVPTPTAIDNLAPTLSTINTQRALTEPARANVSVFRDEWLAIDRELNRRDDTFFVETSGGTEIFGGRFDDDQFQGELVSLVLDDFERDALDVAPEPSFSRTNTSDNQIAADIISLMPAPLNAGAVEQTTTGLDFEVEQQTPAAMLRDLANTTGADVRYQTDGTVEYLAEQGESFGATLSPASGAVFGSVRVRETSRTDATSVRVFSSSDPQTFADSSVAGASGREVVVTEDLSSTSTSRLQTRADTLANEIAATDSYLEVAVGVDPVPLSSLPSVGDRVSIRLPGFGVDDELRVIERDRTIDEDGDRLSRVLLSNRKETLQAR